MPGTLIAPDNYYRAQRVQIVAELSNFDLKTVAPQSGDNDSQLNQGQFLNFKDKTVELFEANAIAHYVSSDSLKGKNQADVLQWSVWSDTVIVPAMSTWVYPTLGVIQANKHQTEKAKDTVHQALKKLNTHLATKTFLVGERLSVADVTVACNMRLLFEHVLTEEVRNAHPHVTRWYLTVMNQPAALKVVGHEPKLASSEAQPDNKRYQELHKGGGGGGHHRGGRKQSGNYNNQRQRKYSGRKDSEKTDNSKKSGGNKKPAAAEPAAQPFKTAAELEAEEEAKPAAKPKDIFATLPKGSFDMDEWKRTYSNNDIASVALPWLWKNFDKQHYSFWYCEYLYNDELSLLFMSANLVGGMYQRLEKLRKHAFGSMAIFGENNKNAIAGVWMWRGTELAFKLDEDCQTDYECYSWKKIDVDADRKLIEQFFLQTGEWNGKKFDQGKIFK